MKRLLTVSIILFALVIGGLASAQMSGFSPFSGGGSSLPSMSGQAGRFLTNDNSTSSWGTPAGAGDMLKTDNLSGVANKTTARANLGDGNALHVFLGDGSMGPASGGDNQTVQAARLGGTGQDSSSWNLCFPFLVAGIWGCDGNTTRELREIGAQAAGSYQVTLTHPVVGPATTTLNKIPQWATGGASYDLKDGLITVGTLGGDNTTIPTSAAVVTGLAAKQNALSYPVTGPASPTAGTLVKWGPSGQALVDSLALGTMMATKYCTYETATGLTCNSNGGGDNSTIDSRIGQATIQSSKLSGTLPVISGANLTGVVKTEADTLATVTGRGGTTTTAMSFPSWSLPTGTTLRTVASSATPDLGNATREYDEISGAVTITGFASAPVGTEKSLRFTGAPQLTYNVTSFILPAARNINIAAGDRATFISLGAGNWVCMELLKANGRALGDKIYVAHGASENANNYDMYGQIHLINGAYTVTAPAQVIGMNARFRCTTAAVCCVDVNASDHHVLGGNSLTNGNKICSDGYLGSEIELDTPVANTWVDSNANGLWTDGGA